MSLNGLKSGYEILLQDFMKVGNLDNSVFVYSVALAKKVKDALQGTYEFKSGEFLLVYAGVLFLSIKLANDLEVWHVEDFAKATGLEEGIISEMEMFVFKDALNFDAKVKQEDLEREMASFIKFSKK